jgi:transposase
MKNITKIHVGVDVSKNKLDIYLHPIGITAPFANTEDGIKALLKYLSGYEIVQVVCESTGGYEDLCVKELRKNGYNVQRVDPNRVKSFIRSKGKKAKTDAIDAKLIALFSTQENQKNNPIEFGEKHDELRDLVKRRDDLIQMISMERLRLNHPSHQHCKSEIQKHISFMDKQVKGLEKRIQDLISKDDDLRKKAEIIESVPGIGKTTAALLLAETPELGMMGNKQIAALVGIAPYTQQSGKYQGKAFISGGRTTVRTGLYMPAMVAAKCNPTLKKFYNRLYIEGKKPAKVALVAVMRKLITILNTMIKNGTKWECYV